MATLPFREAKAPANTPLVALEEGQITMNLVLSWMTKIWSAWDVRLMVLCSLIVQVILFILGHRRKVTVRMWLRIILWFAYLIADWMATAALGKLSETQVETHPPNVLKALWAPMLLLHLGGPDTITAYVLEDNQLWTRHLLGLVFEAFLVIYILFLSLNRNWFSLGMNCLMFIAGIIKYIERTWSLMLASSGQAEGTIPVFDIDTLVENTDKMSDEEKLVVAYQFFSAFRLDITNYISPRENVSSSGTKLIMRFMHNVEMTGLWNINMDYLLQTLEKLKPADLFEIVEIQMGFLFDVLYTKAPITYTKLGCIFRFISVCCLLCVLVCFLTIFRIEPRKHYSMVDIVVTCILLVGGIVIEVYAVRRLVKSNWTVIWVRSRNCNNSFVCRTLGSLLSLILRRNKCRCRRKTGKTRIWSNLMGQFNLVSYCFKYKTEVKMMDIRKKFQRHRHTEYKELPDRLKETFSDPFSSSTNTSLIAPRGEEALQTYGLKEDLKWSTELDFDEGIITWHLVTDICYHKFSSEIKERDTCQVLSNYMMYLLVMQPDMILPGYRRDFWFSHISETLGGYFEEHLKSNSYVLDPYHILNDRIEKREATELEGNTWRVVEELEKRKDRWEIIEAVWLEMLSYAAIACQHVNHARLLRRGGEYLTLLWLRLTMSFLKHT